MNKKYMEFLNHTRKQYRKANRPISLQILSELLSSRFNLSPEFCVNFVNAAYQAKWKG